MCFGRSKDPSHCDGSFSTHIKSDKNNFQIHNLIWRPDYEASFMRLHYFCLSVYQIMAFMVQKWSKGTIWAMVPTKPVFGVSNKVRFKPACLATETS